MTIFWLLLAVIAILAIYGINIYNQLIQLKNYCENAFAQIEVQLKRRYDLIPNIVDTVKGYIKHERETLDSVVKARGEALNGLAAAKGDLTNENNMQDFANKEQALSQAMGRLNVVVEAYPDLKANENILALQEELTTTENKVAFARQAYNDAVTEYNTYKKTFPSLLVAKWFGHGQDAVFLNYADREEFQKAPSVDF